MANVLCELVFGLSILGCNAKDAEEPPEKEPAVQEVILSEDDPDASVTRKGEPVNPPASQTQSPYPVEIITIAPSDPEPASTGQILNGASHPLAGCWESADQLSREMWDVDKSGSGWLYGYGLDRDANGSIKFFEQLRIEVNGESETYVAQPQGQPSIRFEREFTDNNFERIYKNPAHDYPQVITYKITENRLETEVNTLDGKSPRTFIKTRCVL